ncbi:hypothetical protein HYV87_01070 [Candidatus Woesearchaeota archaeon]|nr:hypothetical protein [Candidatus Woesearchaeota archaeon]MBI2581706.1 hypothetical protein [Candidatus Woesearchaeota archaeon]
MKPITKSIEELAEANQIDLRNAQVDGMYRFVHANVYEVLRAIVSDSDPQAKPAISLRPSAIGISHRFSKDGETTLKPVAMIVSGEHICEDHFYGYVITFRQIEYAGEESGRDVVGSIGKYVS